MARALPKGLELAIKTRGEADSAADPCASLLSCMDRSSVEIQRLGAYPPSKAFHPSSMQCERNMFYQLKGVRGESDFSPALGGICESGTDRHLRLQRLLCSEEMRAKGWTYVDVAWFVETFKVPYLNIIEKHEIETKIYNWKYGISFLTDGIVHWAKTNKYYVLEIKTESSRKWYKRDGVDPKHVDQGTIYPLCFGLDATIFLYENRDTTEHKAFMLSVTDGMKEAEVSKMLRVRKAVEDDALPPKTAISDACKYCQYAYVCHRESNGDGEIDPNAREPRKEARV